MNEGKSGSTSDLIEVDPYDAVYGRVEVAEPCQLEELAKNEQGDELISHLQETLWLLLNKHYDTFVSLEQFYKLRTQKTQNLNFHSVLLPSVVQGFDGVFMTAANFGDTLIHVIWSEENVQFQSDPEFVKSLRYSHHPNGPKLDIYYFTERHWSKHLANQQFDHPSTVADRMMEEVHILEENRNFLVQINKGRSLPRNSNATRLPNKPHGLNGYTEFHDIACLAATNLKPDDSRFMEALGLDRDAVRRAIYFSGVYQAAARTSLREPDDDNSKRIIVPDRGAAEYLASLFPGARIHKVDIGLSRFECDVKKAGRSKRYASLAEKSRAARDRAREKRVSILQNQIALQHEHKRFHPGSTNDILVDIRDPNDFQNILLAGTLYESKRSALPLRYIRGSSDGDMLDFLAGAFRRRPPSKDDNFLISPAVFNPNLGRRYRAFENILYLRHIWLDFEDGEISPDEFAALFPTAKMLITNSYSHTGQKPRFRAVIFTDHAMTIEAHGIITDAIAWKLRDAGWWVNKRRKRVPCPNLLKPSGLDWSKGVATSLFYLPCQAVDAGDSFLNVYDDKNRTPIDVDQWTKHSPLTLEAERPIFDEEEKRSVNQSAVDRAIAIWRESTNFPHEGSARFFDLARSLKSAGVISAGIETLLKQEYQYARNPKERLSQIPSILNSLFR
jgi:hypothetical protein